MTNQYCPDERKSKYSLLLIQSVLFEFAVLLIFIIHFIMNILKIILNTY